MFTKILVALCAMCTSAILLAQDWSADARLPGNIKCEIFYGHKVCFADGNRENIYQLDESDFSNIIYQGAKHVLSYPVDITKLKLPQETMEKFFTEDTNSPLRKFIFKIAKKLTRFRSFQQIFKWMGLHDYPKTVAQQGPNTIPLMGDLERYPMGATLFENNGHNSMTFSCAACHSSDLFGVKILGLTNRFPRANETFIMGKEILTRTPTALFKLLVAPSKHDEILFREGKNAMKYIGLKKPLALGLDTSLAQVGLSLALRSPNEYASKIPYRRGPNKRYIKHKLRNEPADSKPAVWWNLKFKTRWLSDGSIISGNPVHTNFLWNEIGRGVDLKELEKWLLTNKKTIKELTAFVFSTQAPRYNDFFPGQININMAKSGEQLFLKNCKGCHGQYDKAWSSTNASSLSYEKKLATTKVWYHIKSKTIDVNTDSYRSKGMNYFANDLNRLKISKSIKTVVRPQKGYIPPPLVGIWSRWPYFHNNSVPTLYDVLTPDYLRPPKYIAVPAESKTNDFDQIKNGYPSPDLIRAPYRNDPEYLFDTHIKGLSNRGHTKMLLDEYGNEKFSHQQKLELIEYLKTL